MGVQLLKEQTKSDLTKDLRCLPCLTLLKEDDFADIIDCVQIRRLCKHEVIFLESEPLKATIVVQTGSVKIYKTASNGRELIVNILWPGEYFCYPPLKDETSNIINAMAFTDATVLMIPSEKFYSLLNKKIGDVGLSIVAGLCDKITVLSDKLDDLAFKSVQQRLLKALHDLTDGQEEENGLVTVPVNHQELASLVGTAREVVSRIISTLKEKKIVSNARARNFKINRKLLLKYIKSESKSHPTTCCGVNAKT
ncbi:MAG: Crp/Fnr family transcriptional regulator [Candidatus Magnetominusculus sp. LBB02]|nr:Crp/Fnr family transcriptional regulator [Candidatus Magnetominusculus sp. LBB02]